MDRLHKRIDYCSRKAKQFFLTPAGILFHTKEPIIFELEVHLGRTSLLE